MHRGYAEFFRRLAANLWSGCRLAAPLPAPQLRIEATLGQLIALLAALWLFAAASDFVEAGFDADYSPWGVISTAAINYVWLVSIAVILAIDRGASQFLRVAVAMAAVLIIQSLAWLLTDTVAQRLVPEFYGPKFEWIVLVFLVWEVLAFARILTRVYDARLLPGALYTTIYAGAAYASLSLLPSSPIFVEPWEPYVRDPVDVENTYYAQSNLLAQSLYALSPQRPDMVDLYFVGFGAYAHQDVFEREIEQASTIFARRFDALGHTVSLINNPKTMNSVPLANRNNLEKVIRGLAGRIDLEEDVVVLFLSSHGDDDGTISVRFDGFGFNPLSAADVRGILDKAGIKWRIVIVSACYSGSFIDALASPQTLVITAAAADRSSFGCSHENEWTYFGEAYFDYALQRSASFTEAFTLAAKRIEEREKDEGKKPSMPQISLGSDIGEYLDAHKL